MATTSITYFELTILDNSDLKKQYKRANLDKICDELIKTVDSEYARKEHLTDIINELIIQGKIIKKTNRNGDSYYANESIVCFNIEQLEYSNLPASDLYFATLNTKQSSSIDLVNTPRNPISTIPETRNLPQEDINGKDCQKNY